MTSVAEEAIALFRSHPWPDQRPDLRAVVAVIPTLPAADWPLVESAHAHLKTTAVEAGLMLGQFHPACTQGAVHNPDFPVLRSPLPALVVRHMALHDLYFLHGNRRWFTAYDKRFAHRYREPGTPSALVSLYHRARQQHAHPAATGRSPRRSRPPGETK